MKKITTAIMLLVTLAAVTTISSCTKTCDNGFEGSDCKTFVFDKGTARKTTLDAGHSDGRMTEVIKGLDSGTELLLHPPDTIKDGVTVKTRAP